MATMQVRNAAGGVETIQKPNANGRAAEANSSPVALSSEDKAALDQLATGIDGVGSNTADTAAALGEISDKIDVLQTAIDNLLAKATSSDASLDVLADDVNSGAPVDVTSDLLGATGHEEVAASAADQVLGGAGGAGDILAGLVIVPATTSPGAVSIKDGALSAIIVFAGGASSVSNLVPFFVPLGIKSANGAWKVTTGTNVSVIAIGKFT
jgi:hypothetical protein